MSTRTARVVVVLGEGQVGLREVPLPRLGPGDALVQVLATPIHPADLNTIEGKYPGAPEPPAVGGREGAGRVLEVGSEVSALSPGDTVLVPAEGGTWRDLAVYAAAELVPVPSSLAPEQAALLRVNPGTALRMLREFLPLIPGEWIAQNAANSAVGRAVVQLARHFGWHTVNLVREPAALDDELRRAGDIFLPDLPESDPRAAAGSPLRLAFNAVGGESALRLANALADGGTLVTYGAMARQPLKIPNGLLIFRDLSFRGFWLTRSTGHSGTSGLAGLLSELAALAVAGVVHSRVETTYPLEAYADALAHAARSRRSGKILFHG